MSMKQIARLQEENRRRFYEASQLRDVIDELNEKRKQAYALACQLPGDLPLRYQLMQLLETT